MADLALENRVPTIAGYSNFADLGGTMSYAADPLVVFRRAVALVDKVLKGAQPMDLPVETTGFRVDTQSQDGCEPGTFIAPDIGDSGAASHPVA